ncbi:MAG: hypothetical protein HS117_19375 [Verrucomicrobiaceae bacterium]|nr:hypothetical protein [Verrucomicrobiaceae bacterium]
MATANTITTTAQGDFALAAKTALLRRGMTVTALAETLGLARNTVSIAINHPTMLPRVKARIRKKLHLN